MMRSCLTAIGLAAAVFLTIGVGVIALDLLFRGIRFIEQAMGLLP